MSAQTFSVAKIFYEYVPETFVISRTDGKPAQKSRLSRRPRPRRAMLISWCRAA
jgi:hypothetical protein